MRPDLLNPVFADVSALDGIGPALAKKLTGLLVRPDSGHDSARVVDLLWHLPVGMIDRTNQPKIAELTNGIMATLHVRVETHEPPPKRQSRRPYQVHVFDDTGAITLVFFHGRADYLRKVLPPGELRYVSGRVDFYDGVARMIHPDFILTRQELGEMPLKQPVYPLTAGLGPKALLKAVAGALARCPDLEEWQDRDWRESRDWASFLTALKAVHAPEHPADLEPASPARCRLAYDELLANQLALGLMRDHLHKTKGVSLRGTGEKTRAILAALPFTLTGAQEAAVAEINDDMAARTRMLRLLQGDVGSGKTIVALMAMAVAIEAGCQAAIMAPTELLARQHMATLAPLCAAAGIKLAILTGREKGAVRRTLLEGLDTGAIDLVIGTHALFQSDVAFDRLGLVVIDEQHRFGVHQRLALQAKGAGGIDVLVMTATPIPRTLTLTYYGDMDVSRITEKPPGRQPVDTRVLPQDRLGDVIDGLDRAIERGARVFWICPLIEDSSAIEAVAAEDRHKALGQRFGDRVGLVHGRMSPGERDQAMARFQAGELDILVATTVVEVGVDVPEASIMVIEHAERFGLAQLHQLRGRVGRGAEKSTCLLLYRAPLGEIARARLDIMRQSDDGFVIAEEDLRLRGGGELLGVRQSGMPDLHIARLEVHGDLLATAHDDARLILTKDPLLQSKRGQALRVLLYLFERNEAVRLLSAG
jgi:ATP-dependent DNA helicase RecG